MLVPAVPSGPPYWRKSDPAKPLMSCEVLSEVEYNYLELGSIGQASPGVLVKTYPYLVVISQDCDLEWDHEGRGKLASAGPRPATGASAQAWAVTDKTARNKLMEGVLLVVADEEEVVHAASVLSSKEWRSATDNQIIRYHMLRPCPPASDLEGIGFSSLVLDFKRYITLRPDELWARVERRSGDPGAAARRAALESPFLEDVVSRFYHYQARVALPDQNRAGDLGPPTS